jgi:hypothetical protein
LVLAKAAFVSGIAAKNVVIDAGVYCMSNTIFLGKTGATIEDGNVCLSASADATIPASVSTVSGLMLTSVKLDSFEKMLEALLTQQFAQSGARWTYLEQTEQFAEIVVRNLRGFVIPGGRYWELLRLNLLYAQAEGGHVLRLIAEGSVAASLGEYPPDSQFTESMDVHYGRELNEFARCMVDRMRLLAAGRNRTGEACGK